MRIGIYGGSFNPPHKGHVNLVKKVCNDLDLDEVWIIPSTYHRFKKKDISENIIHEMLEIVFPSKIKKTGIFYEKDKEEWGGSTYKMMKYFQKEYPKHRFYVIMGADCVKELNKYVSYKKLIKEFEFIIVGRPMAFYENTERGIKMMFPGIQGKFIELEDTSSSSKFKESLKDIPKDVLKYIYKNNLYLEEK